jgi:ABC-2 type transport system permease protein
MSTGESTPRAARPARLAAGGADGVGGVSGVSGVIHDIGYQHYRGPRLGRRAVATALFVHGLRTAFGLGRTAKSKIFPWSVVALVTVIGVVVAAVRSQGAADELTYALFLEQISPLVMLFAAVVAPELLSRDLRSGVLPLYFSRPMPVADYPLTKFAALAGATWLLLAGPLLLMFATAAFDDAATIGREAQDVGGALLYAAVTALVVAAIAALIASFTGKRAFAAGGIVAVFLVTTPVSALGLSLPSATVNELAWLVNPFGLIQGTGAWLFGAVAVQVGRFGPLYGLVTALLVAGCVAALLARYRKVARS